jgi:hypothetical protein
VSDIAHYLPDKAGRGLLRAAVFIFLGASSVWLIFIVVAIVTAVLDAPSAAFLKELPLVGGLINDIIFVRESGFSASRFISPRHWGIYLTVFLAALGALGGIVKVYDSAIRKNEPNFHEEREKNRLILGLALSVTAILGTYTIFRISYKDRALQLLYEFEVSLVRFEGLMFNALSINASNTVIETLLAYESAYLTRMSSMLSRLYELRYIVNWEELETHFTNLEESFATLVQQDLTSSDAQETIGDMLYALERLRVIVRQNIENYKT